MMIRWHFSNYELAWAYANLVGASKRWCVVDYGHDANGFYVDFKKEV